MCPKSKLYYIQIRMLENHMLEKLEFHTNITTPIIPPQDCKLSEKHVPSKFILKVS